MPHSPTRVGPPTPPTQVMASIDDENEGDRLVIADITTDEHWLSIPTTEAVSLTEWR